MSDFLASLKIAATGLHAQTARMRIIAENLANADSAGKTPGEDPYRRKIPTFRAVMDRQHWCRWVRAVPFGQRVEFLAAGRQRQPSRMPGKDRAQLRVAGDIGGGIGGEMAAGYHDDLQRSKVDADAFGLAAVCVEAPDAGQVACRGVHEHGQARQPGVRMG